MKIPCPLFDAMAPRHFVSAALILLSVAGSLRAQVTINIDNGSQQSFAVDATRNFLYVAESSNAGTKHLSVINTLTNTVVGTYSYGSTGYTSQVAASGTNVFWADQGSSVVRVISVNGSGVPSLTRSDAANLATGVAALATTYAVNKQGTGDKMDINLISTGAASFSNLVIGGVASNAFADANTNRFYAGVSGGSTTIFNASTGANLGSLSGYMQAVDPSAAHNFLYLMNSSNTNRLDQLPGTATSNAGATFYDFGAAFNSVTVNAANGDVFVAQTALNRVVQLTSGMAFVQNIAITSPETIMFAGDYLYVHGTGQAYLTAIAIPEPSTWAALLGGAGLGFAIWRRRRFAAAHR